MSARAAFISGPTGKESASSSLMWLFTGLKPLLTVGQRHQFLTKWTSPQATSSTVVCCFQSKTGCKRRQNGCHSHFCNQIPFLLQILFIRKELLGPTDTQDGGNFHKGTNSRRQRSLAILEAANLRETGHTQINKNGR